MTKKPLGILIDARSKISLSQFQLALWTWLFLSTTLAVAFANHTMNIEWDSSLWALLGISVSSGVGALMVKHVKMGEPFPERIPEGDLPVELTTKGLLHVEKDGKTTNFLNIFQAEEVSELENGTPIVDITKVQMFFFTIVGIVGYIQALWEPFIVTDDEVTKIPILTASLTTITSLSKRSYERDNL